MLSFKLQDTKTYKRLQAHILWFYYLLELHDTKTLSHRILNECLLYYLLELHDTKTKHSS